MEKSERREGSVVGGKRKGMMEETRKRKYVSIQYQQYQNYRVEFWPVNRHVFAAVGTEF